MIFLEAWRAELYHFGIKGMKWGVRHDRVVTQRAASRNNERALKQIDKAKRHIKKAGVLFGLSLLYRPLYDLGMDMSINQGKVVAGRILYTSSFLGGLLLESASVVQAAKAGYNYIKSKGYDYHHS